MPGPCCSSFHLDRPLRGEGGPGQGRQARWQTGGPAREGLADFHGEAYFSVIQADTHPFAVVGLEPLRIRLMQYETGLRGHFSNGRSQGAEFFRTEDMIERDKEPFIRL